MRASQKSRRKPALTNWDIEALEPRRLLTIAVSEPIAPILASFATAASNSVTLNQHFFDPTLPGTLVTFDTTEGEIQVSLTDAATPLTVANFLSYVTSNAYNGTIFHRSVDLNTGLGGSPEAPATIVQGGGYSIASGSLGHITTNAPVQDEFQSELYGDVAGTIAMAKTSSADSATSEFYFNVSDNTELDSPTADPTTGAETSYTVFGIVVSGMSAVGDIAALPTYDISDALDTVPVTGLTEAQIAANTPLTGSNLIFANSVTAEPSTTYTATSDNKALVIPTITNGVLSLAYGAGSGTATVTVVATSLDGTSATSSVSVTVPDAATPSAGPTAVAVTAPFTVTGTTGNFSVLTNDTDSLAALNPGTVTITVPPTQGTATVDPSTGHINYTPATGYLGPDTLTYTVADTEGNVSVPAVVTLDAVPGAATLTIGGSAKAASLTFTQPDGVTSHLSIRGATALITFTDYRVTTTTRNGVVSATGLGTTITSIAITNKPHQDASLVITSNGPVEIGAVSDAGPVFEVVAKNGTLTGSCIFGALSLLEVASLLNATLGTGAGFGTVIDVPSVTNTSVTGNIIQSINSKQWLNTDGGDYSISAEVISGLFVSGTFAERLALTGKGYGIFYAKVGSPDAAWGLTGSIFKALFSESPGANWGLQDDGLVRTLGIKGNLANNITAAAIGTLTVSGTSNGSVIETDAGFTKNFLQIGHLGFGGAVTDTVVFSAGNIGSITAASLTNSRIYAGAKLTLAQNAALASTASDFMDDAKIGSVSVGRAANAFSESLITADVLGSLNLGKVQTSDGGAVEGVSAHTIGSISATLVPGGSLKAGPAQLATAAKLTAYETLKKLSLGDLQINLI